MQSDVLVCSIGSDNVDMRNVGGVGRAFSVAGGQQVWTAFKKIGGLRNGTVFLTDQVGSLQCKAILYARVDQWNGDAKVGRWGFGPGQVT